MRKILIALLVVIVLAGLWLWRARDLAMVIDRFHVIERSSRSIKTIAYEGSGTGGLLHVDDVALSLNEVQLSGAQPNIGTIKDGQVALSFAGKVFPLGSPSSETDKLTANVPSDDVATIASQHSAISWPNFFDFNFMTGKSPTWKRHIYQRMSWRKANGAKLEMLWRYEQYFYPGDGWTDAHMTREGSTGLIRIDISNAGR
jgi:hypothetical protein